MKRTARMIRWYKIFLFLTLFLSARSITAQIMEVTTQVVPPFDGTFTNFHTKVLVTIRNMTTSTFTIQLNGTLTSNNVTITFPAGRVPTITMTANQIFQVPPSQLMQYFQEQNVTVSGITKDELYNGDGLPSGNYQLCFRAVESATGAPISMPSPSGCFPFNVQQAVGEDAVGLTAQVIPPYSTYLDDYINQNKLLVILQNHSGTSQELRLTGSIKGNNGVMINIPSSFIPSKPITLSPRQVRQLTGNDLREYFGENVLQVAGASKSDISQGNGLPEGNYQLCLQALDFETGQPRSPGSPLGCAVFDLRQYEPPFLIQPVCNTSVNATQPQNVLFTWSVPAGARPDLVEYVLKIVEMYPQGIDPNQAMQSANIPPFFEKVIRTNSYVYSLADPKLEIGKRYAFRVTARMNTASRQGRRATPLNFRNNGNSLVCTFTYGAANTVAVESLEIAHGGFLEGQTVNVNPKDVLVVPTPQANMSPDPEDSQQCIADCNVDAPANNSPKNITTGDEVQIGKFTMTITSGNNASGTGTIVVNFLNTPVNVRFTNLQVNTDNQVFGNSKATAIMDVVSLANHAMVTQATQDPNLTSDQLSAIEELSQQANRKVSQFPDNNSQAIGLPLSLDYGNFDLVLVGIIFSSTHATLNAITSIDLPQSTVANDRLTLSTSICVRPNGFGEEGELVLMDDKTIPFSNKMSLKFNKNNTKAEFNCDGIEQVSVSGSVIFERNILLPVNNSGDVVGGNTKVSADFTTTLDDFSDWTVSINQFSHSFTVPQLVGFRMTASEITFDQSDDMTPQGVGQLPSWKGLYIGSLNVVLTGVFKKNNNPLTFSVEDFSIGNQGMSGNIDPGETLLLITEGKIGSWPVSVTDFSIELNNSAIAGASIGGKLKLPIAANELDYTVTVMGSQNEDETVDFQFNVQQAGDLDVEMWFAQIELEETSTIGIEKEGDEYKPTANLTGTISINWNENSAKKPESNNKVGAFEVPELAFEELTIADNGNSAPDINMGMAELVNADGLEIKLASFTAHCDPPGFTKNGNKIGLVFDIDLELIQMANSLNGGTSFTIFAEYQNNSFKYKETQLNSISLGGDVGVAKLNGQIDIYQKDPTFGNGFRGMISVVINSLGGAGIDATLQVGRVNNFNYWYFDVMANLGVAGINIPGTMASIYGIGGGAYYNMQRGETAVQTVTELNQVPAYSDSPGANKDGLVFTPQQGTFGFSAAVAFGVSGVSSAFNGDLKFSMELMASGAVNHVTLEGGCYLMQNINDRDGGLITGTLYSEIQPRIPDATDAENAAMGRPNFKLNAGMTMNIANGLVEGSATLDIWFSPDEWWIKLGEWTNEDEPWNDDARMHLSVDLKIVKPTFHAYFMVGSNIPDMPNMPLAIREVFEDDPNQSLNPSPRIGLLATNNPEAVQANPGIAFGAGFYFGADLDFLIFYADIEFIQGFDVVLKKYENSPCGAKIGVNGWFAKGQAYAYLSFDVGVQIDIWVWEGKASILKATAAATLQAALPNPTWVKGQFVVKGEILNGLFKFNTGFRFEVGEKCDVGGTSPFDEMPIVSDITPDDKENNVSVYIVPETAFNFPKDPFSYQEEVDGELVEKTYKYVFKSFTISYKDPNTNANKVIDLKPHMNYRPDGYSATYYFEDMMLPEHTNVNYTIYVEGWQMEPGAPKKVHEESYTGSFTSGSWPTHIEPEQLVQGSPQFRQNFFLKNEEPKGFMKFKNPHSHLTDKSWWYSEVFKLGTYTGMGSGNFSFKARFTELSTGQVYETNYSMETSKKMIFNIPAGMKNSAIYQLELVVHFTPPINSFVYGTAGNVNQTYENVLLTGQEGGGGLVAANNMMVQMQNDQPSNPQNMVINPQALNGNQQILANNYVALANVNPQIAQGSAQNFVAQSSPTVATFNMSNQLTLGGGGGNNGTYIQRKKNELINKKKGEQGIEWELFDDLQWFFKTSKFSTLQAKLNHMKDAGIVYHEYTGNYDRFNGADAVHEPIYGEGSQIPITTKVPVVLLEIQETFEKPYEIGGYSLTIANNENEQIVIPPMVSILHSENNDWFETEFIYSPDNPYNIPDADDWAQFPFYDDEEAMFLGYYAQLGIPYPDEWWENFIPDPGDDDLWSETRHAGGNNAKPFGNKNYGTHYEMAAGSSFPLQEFYKNSNTHGSINFGNKTITWFKTTPLAADDILNAMQQGNQNQGGGNQGGGLYLQANVYQINPDVQMGPMQLQSNVKQHLAIIDFTEWVAMRDFYLLQKHVYTMNEEEEGSFFFECSASIEKPNPHNCFYPSIKNWINNIWYYQPRPSGGYSIKLGNNETYKHYYYDINSVLNPGN